MTRPARAAERVTRPTAERRVSDSALVALAWALLAITALSGVVGSGLSILAEGLEAVGPLRTVAAQDPAGDMGYYLTLLAFATVGAVAVRGQPRNPVGWLLLAFGLLASLGALTGVAAFTLLVRVAASPLGLFVAWLGLWLWGLAFAAGGLGLLRFPDGGLPSPRWRLAEWVVLLGAAGMVVFGVLVWPYRGMALLDTTEDATLIGPLAAAALPIASAVLFTGILLCLVSLVVRFWRSRGIERLQLKWLSFAVGVAVALHYGVGPVERLFDVEAAWLNELVLTLAILAIPLSIAIAVTRHGLYEIDRIVSRTVSYALVTVVLVAVYAGSVVGLRAVLDPVVGDSDLAIAGSTLVVAAAFGPVRRRAQALVDRRFNRRRYDAQQAAARFAQRLRGAVDLDEVAGDLRTTVATTVQPAQLSLWLVPERVQSKGAQA
jgi:hypothetical protein